MRQARQEDGSDKCDKLANKVENRHEKGLEKGRKKEKTR